MRDVRDWISEHAIPLATVEANHGFADLEPLRRIIGTARILSLGEATHGSREFFQLKHRLLEFAVAELGFTIFALEANFTECLRINDYVLGGRGSAADVLAGTRFWTWDTEEVLALIEWMRDWNGTHARQVKFYGFDMQFPTEPALATLDYLRRVAPGLYEASAGSLDALCDDLSSEHFRLRDDTTQKQVLATIEHIRTAFDRERATWIASTGTREWQLARLNAAVLAQSARLTLPALAHQVASRDLAMAENVAQLLALEGEQSKAVLWAHNGHVVKESRYREEDGTLVPNMGSQLKEKFGSDQVVVGFAFNHGAFQAIERGRGLVHHTVPAAPADSLDGALAEAGLPFLLLDLSTAPSSGPVSDWLASAPQTRTIGSMYSAKYADRYWQAADPRCGYDVLAYVEHTTAARATSTGRRSPTTRDDPAAAPANLALAGTGDAPSGWKWLGAAHPHAHRLALLDGVSPSGCRAAQIARASAPWRWGLGRLEQGFLA